MNEQGTTWTDATPSSQTGGVVGLEVVWSPDKPRASNFGPETILVAQGCFSPEEIQQLPHRRKEDETRTILELMVSLDMISELQSLETLARYFKAPFRTLTPETIDRDAFSALPQEYLQRRNALPIAWEDGALVVASSDPSDIFLRDDLRCRLGGPVHLVTVTPEQIHELMEEFAAGPEHCVDEIVADFDEDSVEIEDEEDEKLEDLERIAGESPVIRYVNYVISSAVNERASDIHIEPGEKKLRVRFRMDGILFDQAAPPPQMHAAIISRLKIMANLDIAERRLPQDGRIRAKIHNQGVDLRVSTLPTVHGEKCVIRILDNRSICVGLENLGFSLETLELWKREILQPHGIILVTGPTGSGKSTTLYSSLQIMDRERMNISTVEDPVEYELEHINQVNVRDTIGMSFAAALRSLLRQDPDIIMVGEVRDQETARIAVQASLTGHLVLSTLHTNDAPSSITRLINIGVEPYLISASVNAVLAQRLVRRICPNCKEETTTLLEHEEGFLKRRNLTVEKFFRGRGCEKCRKTGYKGRLGLYELLLLNDELRDVITSSPALGDLRRFAQQHGMVSLQQDGLRKVITGETTIEEIMRVTET
ncbi:MAG: type II/IV secretion system protein [Phycisphaerae bacterium]|nr:type II/IV secretion system protein [Phycisphaerae bacterium]